MATEPYVNVITLHRDGEHYVFMFDDRNVASTLKALGRMATNPELNFTWYDAAVISKHIKRMTDQSIAGRSR